MDAIHCPHCRHELTLGSFLEGCQKSVPDLGRVLFDCPQCQTSSPFGLETGKIHCTGWDHELGPEYLVTRTIRQDELVVIRSPRGLHVSCHDYERTIRGR